MTAIVLIAVLGVTGLLCWPAERLGPRWPGWLAILGLLIDLVIVLGLWSQASASGPWLDAVRYAWIPQLGISLHFGIDGLSLLLVGLACVVGLVAIAAAWRERRQRDGLYYLLLLWSLAGITGVFVALDLVLFYFFWEIMLVPTYLLFLWGRDRQLRAAVTFFLYTQLSGLLMLVAILGLYVVHGQATGTYTFDFVDLTATRVDGPVTTWLLLGFWVAFAVKLPILPFHTWLPDAYSRAPTGVTIVLAGIMAKTAGYGLLRFAIPLFPEAAAGLAPAIMAFAAVSILYASWTAFGQRNFKRLVAYSSITSMGFVMLGAFASNDLAWQGATLQMLAHGLSIAALFLLAGALQERLGGTEFERMGGLWAITPRLGAFALVFALATLGLPGLGNFVGEFLVLAGAFQVSWFLTALAAPGLVLTTVYALWLIQRVFQGESIGGQRLPDATGRETLALGLLLAGLLWLGLFPQQTLDLVAPSLSALRPQVATTQQPGNDVVGVFVGDGELLVGTGVSPQGLRAPWDLGLPRAVPLDAPPTGTSAAISLVFPIEHYQPSRADVQGGGR